MVQTKTKREIDVERKSNGKDITITFPKSLRLVKRDTLYET